MGRAYHAAASSPHPSVFERDRPSKNHTHAPDVCEEFYAHPEGEDTPYETFKPYAKVPKHDKFTYMTGKAGDIIITHALLPHASSPNRKHTARVISNPHVCLNQPLSLNREDGDYVSDPSRSFPATRWCRADVAVACRTDDPASYGPNFYSGIQDHPPSDRLLPSKR